MAQEEPFTIATDCYDQDTLTEMVTSLSLPDGSQAQIQPADNVAFLANPTVVASIVAGSALIISNVLAILIRELLEVHKEKRKHRQNQEHAPNTDADSNAQQERDSRLPAVVVSYRSGPSHVVVSLDRVPHAIEIETRGISEIRLTLVEQWQVK